MVRLLSYGDIIRGGSECTVAWVYDSCKAQAIVHATEVQPPTCMA